MCLGQMNERKEQYQEERKLEMNYKRKKERRKRMN